MRPAHDVVAAVSAVLRAGEGASGMVHFPAELPVFAGHFPGKPLVPGVYLLAAVAEVARRTGVASGDIRGIERAKWSAPAFPAEDLRIVLTSRMTSEGWRVDGEINGPRGLCATCRLMMGA